ncbi:DNA-directed RNA polymerase sigma-70 factor [Sphaerisporangium melleum]|uniref:DNA-directed RNA polymerase sigma-70 factor n=1 Tax=Sphaerisporangium melleum TaxID=321316 RepID=A0A917RJ45_9ACTN|nr:RNA polymerase sigma factor [Sphaerisporangium melleum]GGL09982.1 DNA-directed RNA polymerase sigma-70 factor [Sphaerisporangium melleum]GII70792.1 DNA-directed RNA polymerase sigma-70 factor [Sphaerisporangium melleum]
MTLSREAVEVHDAILIERSLDEPEIFSVLFDRHAPLLHRYATRRLGPSEAEDIVADTFLAAFQHRGDYDRSRSDARPWLYGIASNVIGKRRRAETSLYRAYIRSGVHPAELSGLRVEDGVGTLAVNRPLAQALLDLSQADRDVLLLVAWAELSYQEVAEALAIPPGTVASRLNRARHRVRHALNRQEQGE